MLDVHPAPHAASSLKEFLIHIATIVLGLLIAVGLEQTVEFVHHRRQVAETREALQRETAKNVALFAIQTEEFHRFTPLLLTDAAILRYLRDHPHSPPQQWPGTFDFYGFHQIYLDAAWKTAQQSGVLDYMPGDEVARFADLNSRLELLSQLDTSYRDADFQARAVFISQPDPSQFTPAQIELANERVAQTLVSAGILATSQRNLLSYYPEFGAAPPQAEINQVLSRPLNPRQNADREHYVNRVQQVITGDGDPKGR
jgi:hypothetical protein